MGFTRISGIVLIQSPLSSVNLLRWSIKPINPFLTNLYSQREKDGNQVVFHDQTSELYLYSPLADQSGLSSLKLLFLRIVPVLNTCSNIVELQSGSKLMV